MLADIRRYFDQLTRSGLGDADGFVEYVSRAAVAPAEAAEESAEALAELPRAVAGHGPAPRESGR